MTILFQRPEFAKTSVKSANHVSQPRDVTLAKVREYLLGLRSAKSDQLSTDSGEGTPSSKGSSGEVTTRRSGQRGRSSEVTKRRTRSLSRDKSGDGNNTKCSSGFGQHTLERARQRQRRRRNSEQGTVWSVHIRLYQNCTDITRCNGCVCVSVCVLQCHVLNWLS